MKLSKLMRTGAMIATTLIILVGCGKSEKEIKQSCASRQTSCRLAISMQLLDERGLKPNDFNSTKDCSYLESEDDAKCPINDRFFNVTEGKVSCPNHGILRSFSEPEHCSQL